MEGSISASSSCSGGSARTGAPAPPLDAAAVARAFESTRAAEWGLAPEALSAALHASVAKAFAGREPSPADVDRYIGSLHLNDLALATACAEGLSPAWDVFVRDYRPVLYRAADAIDPSGSARELADGLYADLYGLRGGAGSGDGSRASLFRYFHGRSALGTWLRAVLSQRLVDARRSARRLDPLPEEEPPGPRVESREPDAEGRTRALQAALAAAIEALADRDRLRLLLYYAQGLTLAVIGRQLGEHEATVSRQIARARRRVKDDVDERLRAGHGLDAAAIEQCWRDAIDDAGTFDLTSRAGLPRKDGDQDRSRSKERV